MARDPNGPAARAMRLLVRHLSKDQHLCLAVYDYFDVVAPSGRRWRIHRGRTNNVEFLDNGRCRKVLVRTHSSNGVPFRKEARPHIFFCAHLEPRIPAGDTMLAQKLLLETPGGEETFLAVAN